MADFLIAYKKTMDHEGGYINHPQDRGKETYKGVSRRFWPSWQGWEIIDDLKQEKNFPKNIENNQTIQSYVLDFYKKNFWDSNNLDQCISQSIAEELFDTGTNMGTIHAAYFLQTTLNLLNKNQVYFQDLKIDGHLGPITYNALNLLYKKGEEAIIYKMLNVLQGMKYIEIMENRTDQQIFARGWFSRVEFLKK